jgi:flagellar biosynthesis/type III secretory pathway M-ring protein FliF/YscJ
MPTWLVIVIAVLVVLIVLFAIGGYVVVRRRAREREPEFEAQIAEANSKLAEAHAADKGWEPVALREAARRLFEQERPGAAIRDMQLVAVEDKPGIEEDLAVFRFESEDGAVHTLTLGRTGDGWRLEKLA